MCQPRRLAAVGVATRVHDELGEASAHVQLGSAGSRIGYMVRGDSKCCATSCQLLFCTTGVLLQRLRSDPTLANVTHLIVHEVREVECASARNRVCVLNLFIFIHTFVCTSTAFEIASISLKYSRTLFLQHKWLSSIACYSKYFKSPPAPPINQGPRASFGC